MRPAAGGPETPEDGSVTVLVLGLAGVLLAMVAVVVDVSAVILAKRAVASAADGAASLAAQQADEGAIRRDGVGTAVRLDPTLVAQSVADYEVRADRDQPGLQLRVTVAPGDLATATVTATRTVRLPFVGWLGVNPDVAVRAVSTIRSGVAG
ncbi:MAG: pilus assembly protein TadG-related protein [Actinomycetota bacterium]|nr:pilus assembly protein TadG-related protein [Actinomycetota bacterium]